MAELSPAPRYDVMVDKLEEIYESWELDVRPPPEGPMQGAVRQTGGSGLVRYVFSEGGELGPYLEYYSFHRIGGDAHARIYETGEVERLDTLSTMHIVTGDPEKDRQTVKEQEQRNRRLLEELDDAGLLAGGPVPNSFTINAALVTGVLDSDEDAEQDG